MTSGPPPHAGSRQAGPDAWICLRFIHEWGRLSLRCSAWCIGCTVRLAQLSSPAQTLFRHEYQYYLTPCLSAALRRGDQQRQAGRRLEADAFASDSGGAFFDSASTGHAPRQHRRQPTGGGNPAAAFGHAAAAAADDGLDTEFDSAIGGFGGRFCDTPQPQQQRQPGRQRQRAGGAGGMAVGCSNSFAGGFVSDCEWGPAASCDPSSCATPRQHVRLSTPQVT